jgi:hypothetical protein
MEDDTMRLDDIISGNRIKHNAEHIRCIDGTELSVQASSTHYCAPRTDTGPYTHVEVGYPSATPPRAWAGYADGEYPDVDVYGYVPVDLVREYIEAHGGEAWRAEARQRIIAQYGTYEDDEGHEWINAPGACSECCAGQRGELNRNDWGRGHFACSAVPDDILQADKDGLIGGMYHGNSWLWY